MPTSAEPGRPNRRRPLGRGPGAAEQEAFPDPAPSRNRGETLGPPPAPDAEGDAAAAAAPAPADAAGAPERAIVPGPGDAAPGSGGGGLDEVPGASGWGPGPGGTPAPAAVPGPSDGGSDVASGAPAGGVAAAGPGEGGSRARGGFTLRLDNFEGPFDLLLQLISRHKLDVTEVALSKVTDEFMAYIRAMGPDWDLDQTTEFLVVAATLLDLKAARLLPVAEVEDEADLALLEARDLLFARLLQYKAYKRVAEIFQGRAEDEARRYPRTVGLEPHLAGLLPDVVIGIGAEGFARLAVRAMQPKAKPQVYVDHIHAPLVSVREQAGFVVALLRARGEATFQELTEDAPDTLTVVARFLALLELYREKAVVLDQEEALRTLTVRWSGGDGDAGGPPGVSDEFDRIVEVKE
ncbi:segregation and condensation protein A [Streptomyces goshikiensis]|uniref:segregation and condensation protein A n=1 Tax=Streptomyces goshikiensis TaxID=1942 RepID=UPI003676D24B